MIFPKTLFSSIFGLVGVGVAGSIIASNALLPKESRPNSLDSCNDLSVELFEIFSEIKENYRVFKENFQKAKSKLSSSLNSSDLSKINDTSCFGDYWNLLYNLLKPLLGDLEVNKDPKLAKLKESADNLSNKIDEFYYEKEALLLLI